MPSVQRVQGVRHRRRTFAGRHWFLSSNASFARRPEPTNVHCDRLALLCMKNESPNDLRVSLEDRGEWVTAIPGRSAAVVLPVINLPSWGQCTVVTLRATINGHTGARMSHAGDVVLFGGSLETGESPADAALRELCEESNTLDHLADPDYQIRDHLGQWITESGFTVDGYLATLPPTFYNEAQPDPREVDRLAYLNLDTLVQHPPQLEYHTVEQHDIQFETLNPVMFESPTITLFEASTDKPWTLWGLAGFMASRAHQVLNRQP